MRFMILPFIENYLLTLKWVGPEPRKAQISSIDTWRGTLSGGTTRVTCFPFNCPLASGGDLTSVSCPAPHVEQHKWLVILS